MVHVITPIISTAAGIAAAYGAGTANCVGGGAMGLVARPRLERAAHEVAKYKILKNDIQQYRQERQARPTSGDPFHDTVDKIKIATEDCFESALISRQVKHAESSYRVDKANQASFYAQSVMGGAQVAVATSSIGHATFAVTMAAIGFSFISAIFYLGASIYGFAIAQKQLSENRQRQQDVLQAIGSSQAKNNTDYEECVSTGPDSDILVQNEIDIDTAQVEGLKNTLEALKTEEAFLVQQRNTQAINIVAALMSLVAVCLFTAGTQGIGPAIYYVLLAGSILLPLIAMGYSHCSMNETKYMKALQDQLDRSAWKPVKIDENTTPESLLELIIPMLNLEVTDPEARKEVKKLLDTLISLLESPVGQEQTKKLHELFEYLQTLHDRLTKEDLYCRLKIAGMTPADLAS